MTPAAISLKVLLWTTHLRPVLLGKTNRAYLGLGMSKQPSVFLTDAKVHVKFVECELLYLSIKS